MFESAKSHSEKPVRLAFLQFIEPSLPQALEELAAAGVQQVTIFPLFVAGGGHVDKDIPAIAAEFRGRYGNVDVEILPALGENAEVQALVGQISAAILDKS